MATLNDTLEFWHPRKDEQLPADYFDWGIIARGSSDDRQFRIKNLSAVYDAAGVIVSLQTLNVNDNTLTADVQHFLSVDGASFAATANLGTLAAGAVSGLVTLRRVTPPEADEGDADFQLLAHPTEWL